MVDRHVPMDGTGERMTDEATITLQPTAVPRLEAPSSDTPPSPQTPDDPFGAPQAAPMSAPAHWSPEEATQLVASLHSIPGVAWYLAQGRTDLAEAWRADPKEIAHAGPATARVLDRYVTPGQGVGGTTADIAIVVGSLLGLVIKHRDMVLRAAAQNARDVVTSAPPQPRPAGAGAQPASAPSAPTPPAPEEFDGFDPHTTAFLAAQAAPAPTLDPDHSLAHMLGG